MQLSDLVFLGFGKRVVALHRDTGEIFWQWSAPRGSGYAAVLLDGDRLIVSVMGYTYCLDPATGTPMWQNDLQGLGTGVTSIASVRGNAGLQRAGSAEIAEQQSHSGT